MTKKYINTFVFLGTVLSSFFIYSSTYHSLEYSGGIANQGCSNGGHCHGSSTNVNGSLDLSGIPTNYIPGATYAAQICLTDPTRAAGGFSLAPSNFSISAITTSDPNARKLASYLTHNGGALVFDGANTACWNFNWEAPVASSGNITINAWGNAVDNTGGTSGDNAGYMTSKVSTEGALPVSLSHFMAKKLRGNEVLLEWETQEEINNDYFEVERSLDNKTFTTIGRISGVGHSSEIEEYEFIDENPIPNQTQYYRLKQVDFDGAFEYSIVRKVILEVKMITIENLYPNPIYRGNEITVKFNSETAKEVDFIIYDVIGHVLKEKTEFVQKGLNKTKLSTTGLAPGNYFINIRSDNREVSSEMFLVTE